MSETISGTVRVETPSSTSSDRQHDEETAFVTVVGAPTQQASSDCDAKMASINPQRHALNATAALCTRKAREGNAFVRPTHELLPLTRALSALSSMIARPLDFIQDEYGKTYTHSTLSVPVVWGEPYNQPPLNDSKPLKTLNYLLIHIDQPTLLETRLPASLRNSLHEVVSDERLNFGGAHRIAMVE